jgi:hypothetical protein
MLRRLLLACVLAGCGAASPTTTALVERVSGPALLLGAAVGASAMQGAADRSRRAEREQRGPRTGERWFYCPLDADGGEEVRADSLASATTRCHELGGEARACERCREE